MKIKQRSAYAAAAHVLRAPTLSWIMEGNLDDEQERINWTGIMAPFSALSGGEQALVNIAQDLWRDTGEVQIVWRNLDDACWERVAEALLALRPLPTVRPATEIADEAIGMFLDRLSDAGIYLCERSGGDTYEDADPNDTLEVRREMVQEIREGMAVRDEDIR